MKEEKCEICKKSFPEDQLITGHGIYHEVEDIIRSDYPEWKDNSRICKDDLNKFRSKMMRIQEIQIEMMEEIKNKR